MSDALIAFFEAIKTARKPKKTTPKNITAKYGASRRGPKVIEAVNKLLETHDLTAEPEFGSAYFYGEIIIIPKRKIGASKTLANPKYPDPIPRLSLLKASNLQSSKLGEEQSFGLVSVSREASITQATTLMLQHDFSQLPVLSTPREVVGIVSWKSLGTALALGKSCQTIMDCIEEVAILNINEPLFKAVKIILEREVVLVRDNSKVICGIVTATDVGLLFHNLAEPFLIIEQIENLVRRLLGDKLTLDDVKKVLDTANYDKEIESLSDLTFGHYIRIIENKALFEKLDLNVDRVALQRMLENVRKIRNDVMHFNPEALEAKDLEVLRQTSNFLNILIKTVGDI